MYATRESVPTTCLSMCALCTRHTRANIVAKCSSTTDAFVSTTNHNYSVISEADIRAHIQNTHGEIGTAQSYTANDIVGTVAMCFPDTDDSSDEEMVRITVQTQHEFTSSGHTWIRDAHHTMHIRCSQRCRHWSFASSQSVVTRRHFFYRRQYAIA